MGKEFVNKINFLIDDEYEAIDGYDEVIEFFNTSKEPNKDIIIKQLKHIREEEEEHIKELNELKKVLLKPSYKPDLDTLKEAKIKQPKQPKEIRTYMYSGPISRFGKVVEWDWGDTTQAPSKAKALSQLAFKAGQYLGLDVGTHHVKIELDPDCVYETQDEDESYFDDVSHSEVAAPVCDKCGTPLTDGGYCPVCDDGEQDY